MRWIFILTIVLNALTGSAQLISLDNSSGYVGKTVTVYGKITEATFNETRKRDTCTLKLLDEKSGQLLLVKILPETRAGFGYRPEQALLNKLAYFSGNLQMNKGVVEMYINSPFSISFKQGEAITEPKDQPLPPQPKPKAPKNNEALVRTNHPKPEPEREQPALAEERKMEPKVDKPRFAKKSKRTDETTVVAIEKPEIKQNDVPADKPANTTEKPAGAKKTADKTVDAVTEKSLAIPNPYNLTNTNPNHLSAAPVSHINSLVGTEMILKSKINLRGGPGGFFTTTGSINKGEIIKILSCSFDWCKVSQVKNGEERLVQGYVKSNKLK